jgi:hypothetical protein
LSFVTADGQHRTSEDLNGKAVVLSFWASWCKPCLEALPELRRLHAKYQAEPFAMIGVNLDNDEGAAKSFIQEHQMAWPQAIEGGAGTLGIAAGAQGIPLELVFDHEGVLVGRSRGWSPEASRNLSVMVSDAVSRAKEGPGEDPQGRVDSSSRNCSGSTWCSLCRRQSRIDARTAAGPGRARRPGSGHRRRHSDAAVRIASPLADRTARRHSDSLRCFSGATRAIRSKSRST